MPTPEQQREYQRQWLAARRQAWLDEHGPCVKCGSSDRLEVDHVDPTQKITHSVWSWAKDRREAELAKCQVLCHDCHQEKSVAAEIAKWGPREHGTVRMYDTGCRCVPCVEDFRRYFREKRREQRARKRHLAQLEERPFETRQVAGSAPAVAAWHHPGASKLVEESV